MLPWSRNNNLDNIPSLDRPITEFSSTNELSQLQAWGNSQENLETTAYNSGSLPLNMYQSYKTNFG